MYPALIHGYVHEITVHTIIRTDAAGTAFPVPGHTSVSRDDGAMDADPPGTMERED